MVEIGKKVCIASILFIAVAAGVSSVSAQDYPDTLWIPVTFYDYLSNPPSLNPDFENCNNGLEEGLVKDELNDLKRPVPDTNADLSKYEFYDCHANLIQWYTPGDPISYDSSDYNYETNRWKNDANLVEWDPSAYTHPDPDLNNYDFPAVEPGDSMYVSADFDINDPMACVVIYDSLPFLHRGEGVYEFIRNDDDQFFWLDNRGFGDEGREHNYSFAMELHTTFIKSPGLTFSFLGDDDVWAFVDNELAMDLGGVHAQKDGSFNVDDLGLEDWNEYQFDFFYAERHTSAANIQIMTNLVSTHFATNVTIEADPPDAFLTAGDTVDYTGKVWFDSTKTIGDSTFDTTLVDSSKSENITWSYTGAGQGPWEGTELTNSTGMNTQFTSELAYEEFEVIANYEDPNTNRVFTDTAYITMTPDVPDHIVLEASPDTSSLEKKQNDTPIDTLVIQGDELYNDVFGIIRDRFGNFIDYSQHTSWSILSGDGSVIDNIEGEDGNVGRGSVYKIGISGTGTISGEDTDHSGDSYIDTTTVRVLNEPPVADDDHYSTGNNTTLNAPSSNEDGILDNDTDEGGGTELSVSLVEGINEDHGLLDLQSNGDFTYTPASDWSGTATFSYSISDGEFYDTADVEITVTSENDRPVASDDTYSVDEDAVLTASSSRNVLDNDSDPDGDELQTIDGTSPSHAESFTLDSNGTFYYEPEQDFNGTDEFTYRAYDGSLRSSAATVTITVDPVNDPPVANDDEYTTEEDNTLSVSTKEGALSNDHDVDGDELSALLIDDVSNGTLSLNESGSFTYEPDQDFNGTETFTYRATDGTDTSNLATATITVTPVNDDPVSYNDNYSVDEDSALSVDASSGVLANDNDPDGDELQAVLVSGVDDGYLSFSNDGSFEYTPPPDYNGTVMFSYKAYDGNAYSRSTLATISVSPVNDKPVADDDAYNTDEDVTMNVSAEEGVLANDYDVDGDKLYASVLTQPGSGVLELESDGSFTYDPEENYIGTIEFGYVVNDSARENPMKDTAGVTIYIGEDNDPPVAEPDTFTVAEDNTLPGNVLTNDSDPNPEDTLKAVLRSDVSHGTLTLNDNGSFEYTPDQDYNGRDEFAYRVTDGRLYSSRVTVVIDVTPVNDPPVASDDSYSVDEDNTLNIPAAGKPGLLANDHDVDGDGISVNVSGVSPSSGTLDLRSSGSFSFTPEQDFSGTVTFEYTINDGTVDSEDPALVTITVNEINDPPEISEIPDQTIDKGSSFSDFDLDDYVTDPDNTNEEISWSVSGNSDIEITIDPATNEVSIEPADSLWDGSETVTFRAEDSDGGVTTQTADFTVNQVGTLPEPETDSTSSIYTRNTHSMNLFVPGHSSSEIYYEYTTDGSTPADPTQSSEAFTGSGVIDFGSFSSDSVRIKVKAYSSEYPYEDSRINSFEYLLDFPSLPDIEANLSDTVDYEVTDTTLELSVPGHSGATIYYTLDGSDPASGEGIEYTEAIDLGPYDGVTEEDIRVYAEEDGYKSSTSDFTVTFNPASLPKPYAVPEGRTFYSDSLDITLDVDMDESEKEDVEIRYTLNGSKPDSNSRLYEIGEDTVTIGETTTLRAIAIKAGQLPGPVMTEEYYRSIPSSIVIYPSDTAESPYPSVMSATAGESVPFTVRIFDQNNSLIDIYSTEDAPVTWSTNEINGNETGNLIDTTGLETNYIPEKAYNTVRISAEFTDLGYNLESSVTLQIKPDTPTAMYIEGDHERNVSPNFPAPLDTVQLSSQKLKDEVYAVLRDSKGNYVSSSENTDWFSDDTGIASVSAGYRPNGEGKISKGLDSGATLIGAQDLDYTLSDSVVVNVLPYWFDSLRIVIGDDTSEITDTLIMNTNQDTTVRVIGSRDDGLGWEPVNATWELVDNSLEHIISSPPSASSSWELSPVDTATGRIRVTLDDDAATLPDTLNIHFEPGPPTRAEFELLTPRDSLIAGHEIETELRLYNQDNKLIYSGDWNFPNTEYQDLLGPSPLSVTPDITVNGSTYDFDPEGTDVYQSVEHRGTDTVDFTLYHAPVSDDSLHTLTVDLGNGIQASTNPFKLLPDEVSTLEIVDEDSNPRDSIEIPFSQEGRWVMLYSWGYDQWGNPVELITSNWSKTGEIPDVQGGESVPQIYYTIPNAIKERRTGNIHAVSIYNDSASDSVKIIIKSKPAEADSIYTRDLDGDGLLDAVEITYDKPVDFPSDSAVIDDYVTIENIEENIDFDVNGVISTDTVISSIDSVSGDTVYSYKYTISFKEDNSLNIPQTAWDLDVSIGGIESVQDMTEVSTTDGAPPVVWRVIKETEGKDVITVELSEPFVNSEGEDLAYAQVSPADIFNVYLSEDDSKVLLGDALEEIDQFTAMTETTLEFQVPPDVNLNHNHFFTLKSPEDSAADNINDKYLADEGNTDNVPGGVKDPKRVVIHGSLGELTVGPNPAPPSPSFNPDNRDEKMKPMSHSEAFNLVAEGGMVITADFALSTDEDGNILGIAEEDGLITYGQMMVFDNIGNVVLTKKWDQNAFTEYEDELINSFTGSEDGDQSITASISFPWWGYTSTGKPASPGAYKVLIILKRNKGNGKSEIIKMSTNVGITK